MKLRRDRHRAHRRYPRTALWLAGAFGLAALAWMVIGVPALVKYPTDLDVTPRYEGSFTLMVDPVTAAPLDEPTEAPLTVERRIAVDGDESGASRAVVEETIDQRAGDLVELTQRNVYVMDRSTLENVEDGRAFAFEPENGVDRSGAYRLNLPFDVSRDETYDIYRNEVDDTYLMQADPETPTTEIEGLELSNFVGSMDEVPLTDAYVGQLRSAAPLPESLTLDQLGPHLLARGIDVDTLVAALTPVLTPEDTATLGEFAATPIELEYVLSFEGGAAVEPVTGAEVRVYSDEVIGARPVLTDLPTLQAVLERYPEVPEAVAAGEALDELAEAPAIPVFEIAYEQTPASVAEVADEARSMRTQVLAAKVWLPIGLVALAVLSLVIGALVWLRRGPAGDRAHDVPAPPPQARPHESRPQEGTRTTGRSAA